MKTSIILSFIFTAFAAAAPQAPAQSPSPAATECLSKCATTAFGVEATSLTADNIPCSKEMAGPDGYKSPGFKACICKDTKVAAAVSCQSKCQYGTVVFYGFKSFCK